MVTYYVASPIRHALVTAESEVDAWIAGHAALHRIHTELLDRTGEDFPVEISHVRLATPEDIAIWQRLNEPPVEYTHDSTGI
ncbi:MULTISPECIES: hypothetical protein [unclassified Schlesneria]|uniref:hypothetical protein n=1 Tax=Schlesneria TaxID=656899 RepID=UPI002F0AD6A7